MRIERALQSNLSKAGRIGEWTMECLTDSTWQRPCGRGRFRRVSGASSVCLSNVEPQMSHDKRSYLIVVAALGQVTKMRPKRQVAEVSTHSIHASVHLPVDRNVGASLLDEVCDLCSCAQVCKTGDMLWKMMVCGRCC